MALIDLKTDEKLLKTLAELARRGMTPEEIDEQRISFIYSGMPKNSGMSKLDIKKSLKSA